MTGRARKSLIVTLTIAFVCLTASFIFAQQFGRGPGGGGGPGGAATTALTNFETILFSGSGVCAFCHSNLTDSAGNDVSNDAHWRSTMMANAAKDPLWQAKIESEVNRNSHLQTVIEDKCSRCHMGMARYQAITDNTEVGVLNTGFLDAAHPLHEAAMDGVSCTLCHQVKDDNLGAEESFTGKYVIDDSSLRPNRSIFGPYDFPLINPMNNNTGFIPTSGVQMKDSALCGSCHTLYTPTVDSLGNVVGEFPEQMTYLEWEHSGSDKSCQECHIPKAVGSVKISNRPRRLAAREPFGQHHFVGGNRFMVGLLKDNQTDLGITADTVHLDDTIARTMAQLQDNTATLGASSSLENGLLTVNVEVSNLAGHKFPSGFPSRRTWLHMVVTDVKDDIIFESGKPLNDGKIVGNDADVDGTTFEPHHNVIKTKENPADEVDVQVYEAVMLDTVGNVTWTLLSADSYAKDNRLLPNGFDKTTAAPDFSVDGNAVTDNDFQGGRDQVTYLVETQGANGPFTVTIDLLFQSVSYPFMENLKKDSIDPKLALVDRFVEQYNNADKLPIVLNTIQQTIQ